ncbi:hypothetical protein SE15_10370 [Thermanaerothrix daxensis]|uniref:Uncharacterized protein n=1 Tax=Thermanaerothrix daxensis TaxID=869279 RepID=A0A0P6Y0W8_9CHLR|nr:hypothetical protein [Thermanaerothrix daxensis]KPL82529.1 hypothetical protein SE15_10370 [Thermanaerothrix daxensis]
MRKIIFACGTESHVLTSFILSVTEYKEDYKVLLLNSHRTIPYAQKATSIGIWDEVVVIEGDPDANMQLFEALSSSASILHFYSWGFPLFNRLFSLCASKGVPIALTDEGLLSYSPRRRLAGWLSQNPLSHAQVITEFNLDAVSQIWVFSPSMVCEPTLAEIRSIPLESFYQVCRQNSGLVEKFRALFGFPENFELLYAPFIYFRQYFSAIGTLLPEIDAWVDKQICSLFDPTSLIIKDHPAYTNPLYEHPANQEYRGPWEALLILKHIDPSSHIELPKVYLSLSSSALVKTPFFGVEGNFVFLHKLVEPYTIWRDEVLETIIEKLASLYKGVKVHIPATWEEFYRTLVQISTEVGISIPVRNDGGVITAEEVLARTALKYSNRLKQVEGNLNVLRAEVETSRERVAGLEAQLSEREAVLAALRVEVETSRERVAGLEAQLAEREQQNTALSLQKAALQQELDAARHQTESLRQYQQEREQILQNLNSTLLEIYSSTAWKIIQWMWRVRLWLFPRGSWREKVGKNIFGYLRALKKKS